MRDSNKTMKTSITHKAWAIVSALILATLTACDDGQVTEKTVVNTSESYEVQIIGTFKSLHTWSGTYSVAAACFDETSEYSLIQKVLPATATDTSIDTLHLSGVPTTARTVEVAVVNSLRKRIATIYSYDIPEGQSTRETITLNVGTLDVGMFGAINRFVFQGSSTNCSRCHASATATAHLDLTAANAYQSLVGVASYVDPTQTRITPGSTAQSFLYKVITEGDDRIGYTHPRIFEDKATKPFLDIIKAWIEGGAVQ